MQRSCCTKSLRRHQPPLQQVSILEQMGWLPYSFNRLNNTRRLQDESWHTTNGRVLWIAFADIRFSGFRHGFFFVTAFVRTYQAWSPKFVTTILQRRECKGDLLPIASLLHGQRILLLSHTTSLNAGLRTSMPIKSAASQHYIIAASMDGCGEQSRPWTECFDSLTFPSPHRQSYPFFYRARILSIFDHISTNLTWLILHRVSPIWRPMSKHRSRMLFEIGHLYLLLTRELAARNPLHQAIIGGLYHQKTPLWLRVLKEWCISGAMSIPPPREFSIGSLSNT